MNIDDSKFQELDSFVRKNALTPADLIQYLGRNNSSILNLSSEDQDRFRELYDEILNNCNGNIKGQKLEDLVSILFNNPERSFFDCIRNCRTSSNEIDLLLTWNEKARLCQLNASYPFFGDTFLCECKNYIGKIGVTYVGKFYSLLSLCESKLGIFVAWDGVTGKGKWDASNGLIKKIALKNNVFIVVIDKNDLKEIYDGRRNIFSLICDKYNALNNDIDFTKYISEHHPAEVSLCRK